VVCQVSDANAWNVKTATKGKEEKGKNKGKAPPTRGRSSTCRMQNSSPSRSLSASPSSSRSCSPSPSALSSPNYAPHKAPHTKVPAPREYEESEDDWTPSEIERAKKVTMFIKYPAQQTEPSSSRYRSPSPARTKPPKVARQQTNHQRLPSHTPVTTSRYRHQDPSVREKNIPERRSQHDGQSSTYHRLHGRDLRWEDQANEDSVPLPKSRYQGRETDRRRYKVSEDDTTVKSTKRLREVLDERSDSNDERRVSKKRKRGSGEEGQERKRRHRHVGHVGHRTK
jgi:hypothetical protein